ncbi:MULTISPECIES: class I SAM-dependent methyltransferase [unclassified Devosia]|jgi:tRNA (cmo5U34)-methyltransferase|uniref:class I SAM-dependent methyltransferase n=1 Tax=unclassified Devosia TaxID=196773 RepID=UPI000868C410|nr:MULTISPECIES: class I SAM-dependent methyltransferase [unclassified Devosia]MBN9360140.1 class I SAM-dependent methyltransferase [Devosia sp.]ODS86448.1 MAG: methyltransferase [Devosia sp. SCN 66-27]OJX22187.1 MAG: methyltransferase [Devosia sp. 66-14]
MTPPFSGSAVHSYADGPPRQVPGFHGLHRMARMLLAERVPADGRVLVLGAGGGLELRAFAEAQPGWSFDGVDPSADMLRLAAEMTSPYADRIRLHEGYIADAPEGPFDGATSILTFHFIARAQRLETLRQLHRRLKPGAPLVLAHISFAQTEPERSMWIARHVAFGAPDGVDPAQLQSSREAIGTRLSILAPEDEEAMLREAGFSGVSLFYAGLSFRGWVAYA